MMRRQRAVNMHQQHRINELEDRIEEMEDRPEPAPAPGYYPPQSH